MHKILLLILGFCLCTLTLSARAQSILVSDSIPSEYYTQSSYSQPSQDAAREKAEEQINEYVRQMVIGTFQNMVGSHVQDLLVHHHINLFPDVANQAFNHAIGQTFDRPAIKEIVQRTYEDNFKWARDRYLEGMDTPTIQSNVQAAVTSRINALKANPEFNHVVQEVVEKSMQLQNQMVAQTMAKRQAHLAAIQQQQQNYAQQLQQRMQAALEEYVRRAQEAIARQRIQAVQSEVQQQVQQYQQQLQQQYQEAIQRSNAQVQSQIQQLQQQ